MAGQIAAFTYPFCKQTQEMAMHVFSHYHYTEKLWGMIKGCLGIQSIDTTNWTGDISFDTWWANMSRKKYPKPEGHVSLTMPTSWTIWKERNLRVFRNKSARMAILINSIKEEAKLWVTLGTKKCE
jgi:hypothetical protein